MKPDGRSAISAGSHLSELQWYYHPLQRKEKHLRHARRHDLLAVLSPGLFSQVLAKTGSSSQVLTSNTRPDFFLLTPSHCLKKNGTPALVH